MLSMNGKGRIDMSFFMKHKAKVQLMLLAAAAIFTAYGALRGEAGYSAGQGNTDMSGVCCIG